jgi:hypothetical protein
MSDGAYVMMWAPCFTCQQVFGFNPHKVPSIRIDGVRQPICQRCMAQGNAKREAMGLPAHPIHPDAYEPIPEGEL